MSISTNWNKSPTTPKPPTTTSMVTTTERTTESTAMKDMAGMEPKARAQRDTVRKLYSPKRTTGASKNRNRRRLRSARSKHSVWIL